MTKILTLSLLIVTSIGSAQAYCRNNTFQCKKLQLNEEQTRLEKKLRGTSNDSSKIELEEKIEEIQFEAKRMEEKSHSTASHK